MMLPLDIFIQKMKSIERFFYFSCLIRKIKDYV